jgi:hypothetical protein
MITSEPNNEHSTGDSMFQRKHLLEFFDLRMSAKTHLIILLFFCANFAFSQESPNYQYYYEGINKARKSIVVDSLEQSLNHYKATFENVEFVFARDCYNALQVASKLGNHDETAYFMQRCLKQGIQLEILQEAPFLTDFKTTEQWQNVLLVADSLHTHYLSTISASVREEITLMFTEDQRMRELNYRNRFNPFKKKKLNNEWEELNRQQVKRLIEITNEFGFPGERLIGLDYGSMHPKINSIGCSAGMPIVLFIHHFSSPNESHNEILLKQINTGYLHNEHYAIIADFQHTYGKEKFGKIPCYSQRFNPKVAIEEINTNREAIGLLDLSTQYALQKVAIIKPFWMQLY